MFSRHYTKKSRGKSQAGSESQAGSVTFIQYFGSALNVLFLDGAYLENSHGEVVFRKEKAASKPEDMEALMAQICRNVFRHLRKRGIISDSDEWLDLPQDLHAQDNPLYATVQIASAMGYIGIGKNQGQRIRKIGKSMGWEGEPSFFKSPLCLYQNGFTLHAERSLKAGQRANWKTCCAIWPVPLSVINGCASLRMVIWG